MRIIEKDITYKETQILFDEHDIMMFETMGIKLELTKDVKEGYSYCRHAIDGSIIEKRKYNIINI